MKIIPSESAQNAQSPAIMVSIVCITYNQEAYLSQALDSFVSQQTTFPIEIIVHDDASTDRTADILKSYASKYPDLFICIFQKENQYSKGVHIWGNITFPAARGKYIALCEGDDYWTDSLKLQKQVDLLESNQDYASSFHNAKIRYEDKSYDDKLFCSGFVNQQVFTTKDIILENWFSPTASVLFRKVSLPDYPNWALKGYNWDLTLQLLLSTNGNSVYIDEVMSVYRKNALNSLSTIKRSVAFHRNNLIALLRNFNVYTRYRYCHIIYWRIFIFYCLTLKDIIFGIIFKPRSDKQ